MKRIRALFSEFIVLERSIPSAVAALFVVSVVAMNLLANKSVDTHTDWLALDCGIIFSWAVFLLMDTVTKRFGPRAADILADYSKGLRWQDHAVLYRMNAQSSQFEFAFKRNGIPYRVIGGARFFDRAEIKDMLSYLSVIQDPRDELRLLRIVIVPPRGIGAKSVETARLLAEQQGVSLFEILEKAENFPELSRASLRMREFAGMIRDLQEQKLGCADLYDRVLE
ncbi:MAG: hypothetical protein J5940_07415, partial [Clostridia bacterium]|nr:hypothetical protein [Clostridia bacterium]